MNAFANSISAWLISFHIGSRLTWQKVLNKPRWLILFPMILNSFLPPATSSGQEVDGADDSALVNILEEDLILLESPIIKTIDTVELPAEATGVLQNLQVQEGSEVKRGDPLGHIQDIAAQILLRKANTLLDAARNRKASDIDRLLAQKSKEVAETEYGNAIRANQRLADTYSSKEIRMMKLRFESLELECQRVEFQSQMLDLEIRTAEADVENAAEAVRKHQLVSPCEGTIVKLYKNRGEWVEPGTSVLQIIGTQRLRIEGFVSAGVAADISRASKAKVSVDREQNGEDVVPAAITFIEPEINPLNKQKRVFLEVDNSNGILSPGMTPRVEIERRGRSLPKP